MGLLRQPLAAILSLALAVPVFSNSYDAVGNRTQMSSTLAPIPAGLFNYDANGNTTSSGGIANGYDFENHLIQKGGVTLVYDGDGNRVSKTVAGITTTYLVDTQNPTGYAQVLQEQFNGAGPRELQHTYVYGLERISENRSFFTGQQTLSQTFYFDYDGHGSVRALTDSTGAVTDSYDYDAFGNSIHSSFTGTAPTPNNYLFAGEQLDPDWGLWYSRRQRHRRLRLRRLRQLAAQREHAMYNIERRSHVSCDRLSLPQRQHAIASPEQQKTVLDELQKGSAPG